MILLSELQIVNPFNLVDTQIDANIFFWKKMIPKFISKHVHEYEM